jgi:hypothetical protein
LAGAKSVFKNFYCRSRQARINRDSSLIYGGGYYFFSSSAEIVINIETARKMKIYENTLGGVAAETRLIINGWRKRMFLHSHKRSHSSADGCHPLNILNQHRHLGFTTELTSICGKCSAKLR